MGALVALPKLVDVAGEAVKGTIAAVNGIGQAIRDHTKAVQDREIQEVKNAQTQLAREIQQITDDQQAASLARRLSELERGIIRK